MDGKMSDKLNAVPVPVPRPRRHNNNNDKNSNHTSKNAYENVSIDLINKRVNINDENLQENANIAKLQTDKIFLTASSISSTTQPSSNNMNDLTSVPSSKLQKTNMPIRLNELNELNALNGHDMPDAVHPIPAPRRPNIAKIQNSEQMTNSSTPIAKSKANESKLQKFMDLKPKMKTKRKKHSGSYSFGGMAGGVDADECDASEVKAKMSYSMRRAASDSSLSSIDSNVSHSTDNSNVSESKRHATASPRHLLKVLGNTSKMLTESITERVTTRTKDARHRIDRIHKTSRDRIVETADAAKSKLRTVRKNITGTIGITQNLSFGRKKTNSNSIHVAQSAVAVNVPDECGDGVGGCSDRRQTVPTNTELFTAISFNSPLHKKTNNCMNINSADSLYEVPKSSRSISSDSMSMEPPSYEEAIRDQPMPAVRLRKKSRNEVVSGRIGGNGHEVDGNSEGAKGGRSSAGKSDGVAASPRGSGNKIAKNPTKLNSSGSSEEDNVPCPSFPAPILTESLYGRIRAMPDGQSNNSTPVPADETDQAIDSNRNTANSAVESLASGISEMLRTRVGEGNRSESWDYYDGDSDESSSPEPIYMNQQDAKSSVNIKEVADESTYGVLYKAEKSDQMLKPNVAERKRQSVQYAVISKAATIRADVKEILKEFDPLDRKSLDKFFNSKSNELLLLEDLLAADTYGSLADEYHSSGTSETDECNGNGTIQSERLGSLLELDTEDSDAVCERKKGTTTVDEEQKRSVIIHQNSLLPSESSENIFGEVKSAETSTKSSTTRWFITSSNSQTDAKSKKVSSKKGSSGKGGTEEKGLGEALDAVVDEKHLVPLAKTSSMKSMFSNVMNKVESIKRKTSFRSHTPRLDAEHVIEMIPRPCLSRKLTLHEGHLIRLPSGVVEDIFKKLHTRKAFIRDGKFQAYFDKDLKTPKENIPFESITTIQCVNNHKFSDSFVDIYCFQITTAMSKHSTDSNGLAQPNVMMTTNASGNAKQTRACHLYGVAKETERFIWMQKLLECLTDVFPPKFACRFYRAGWCYSKNSVTSTWSGTWLLLQKEKRHLLFYSNSTMNLERMDLRKARCLVLKESDDSIRNLHVSTGPTLVIDCPPYTMYFVMSSARETKIWRHIIQEVAHNNGPSLKEQQITKDDVPVFVDKCINFIYTHGSMSEGIYRKSGAENAIQKLLKKFRSNAYATQIVRSEFTEHDIANALKRFMRDLPQRLLGDCTMNLIGVAQMTDKREKIESYKDVISRLPSIEYQTLRKILGHLHFIESQKEHNKMDYSNLAIVWGPTLLKLTDEFDQTQSEHSVNVLRDLIRFYRKLFSLSAEEITKEQLMLAVLQKYHAAAENLASAAKQSGDLKVWVTIDSIASTSKSDERQQVQVSISPNRMVDDVCSEIAPKISCGDSSKLAMFEVTSNGMQRLLDNSERVFDVVLKWSYLAEADRKNNHLLISYSAPKYA